MILKILFIFNSLGYYKCRVIFPTDINTYFMTYSHILQTYYSEQSTFFRHIIQNKVHSSDHRTNYSVQLYILLINIKLYNLEN